VWSDRLSHAFTRNFGSTQQTTYTMSCLVSRLVDLYNSLVCAHKNEYYELHGNNNSYNGCGVVSWGSCFVHKVVVSRGNELFLRRPMGLLTCTNVCTCSRDGTNRSYLPVSCPPSLTSARKRLDEVIYTRTDGVLYMKRSSGTYLETQELHIKLKRKSEPYIFLVQASIWWRGTEGASYTIPSLTAQMSYLEIKKMFCDY
jgi:hypothetical protein